MSSRTLIQILPALLILGVLAGRPAQAGDKYAGEFLKIGIGSRALGMGGAFVGLSDDATAVYWNPAGVGFVPKNQAFLSHSEEFGQVLNYDAGAFVHPLGKGEAIGISVIRLSLDNIPLTDSLNVSNGNPIYDEGRLIFTSDSEMALLLSYGKAASKKLNIGGTVKLIRQSVADHSSFGLGADLGFIYSPDPSLSLGLALNDITGTFLSWDTGRREHITPSARIGGQVTRALAKEHLVTLTGDISLTFDGRKSVSQFHSGQKIGGDFHFGGEYWYHRTLALRGGYNHGNFTAGAGGRRGRFSLDYAYLSNSSVDLQNTQRISGSVEF